MKLIHFISIFLLFAAILVLFSSCVNIEKMERPINWPQGIEIQHLDDIEGVYKNNAKKTGHGSSDLWFYLTREKKECVLNCIVKIEEKENTSLQITLINWLGKTIGSTVLSSSSDFRLANGYLALPSESGAEHDALGVGVGTASYRLHLADGGLIGEINGIAAGLAFHVVPTIGFGSDWCFWEQIPDAQQIN